MKRCKTLFSLLLCLSLLLSLQGAAFADPDMTVAQKVEEICAECRAQGFTGEYDAAVWLHDWLTAHADYDTSRTRHTPEGVLLYGAGVCESYTGAYQLLLNKMGIANFTLRGEAGPRRESHIWNVARLDGVWCQIDVTFDDPEGGGAENHNYFGLNDTLMARDHFWNAADAAHSCDSLENYYPRRMGALVYTTSEELDALLSAAAAAQRTTIELVYVGSEAEREAIDDFLAWYSANAHVYGIGGFEASFTSYSCRVSSIQYTKPWEPAQTHLDEPVAAPDFTLSGPEGSFSREMYSGCGLVVMFLPEADNSYTAYVLDSLYDEVAALREVGVEVLVCLADCCSLSDCLRVNSVWPGLRYCYWDASALYALCTALHPGATTYSWPLYAVINGESQIVYAADGMSFDATELLAEAFAVGSANPLPEPAGAEPPAQNVQNANLSSVRSGAVKTALTAACAESNRVLFVMDSWIDNEAGMFRAWEEQYACYARAGFSLVARIKDAGAQDIAAYPHIRFVSCEDSDPYFWDLLNAVGHAGAAYTRGAYYLDHDGNILEYVNRGVLDPESHLNAWVRAMPYEASLPAGLTTLEGCAFANTALRTLDLSTAPLRAIPTGAFSGCASLAFVKIPSGVTEIAPDAFADCPEVVLVCPFNSAAAAYAWTNALPLLCP